MLANKGSKMLANISTVLENTSSKWLAFLIFETNSNYILIILIIIIVQSLTAIILFPKYKQSQFSKMLAIIFSRMVATIICYQNVGKTIFPKCWNVQCSEVLVIIFFKMLRILSFQNVSNYLFQTVGNYNFQDVDSYNCFGFVDNCIGHKMLAIISFKTANKCIL